MDKRLLAPLVWWFASACPAEAHVKWFLSTNEAALLAEPKPELFTRVTAVNSAVVACALISFYVAASLNTRWSDSRLNKYLNDQFVRCEEFVSAAISICTGLLLISSAYGMSFFVPNLHLHHCCSWIAKTEAVIGVALCAGFLTRPAAFAMLMLLGMSFARFSFSDCVDLLPMYGVATYLLIAGRKKFSVDSFLRVAFPSAPALSDFAYTMLRFLMGAGLVYLGLDEKLINPQLSLNVLSHAPGLNFLVHFGITNDLFVLCSGITEVLLGIMLLFGIFPRLVVFAIACLFAATTVYFGPTELVGHLAYYPILFAIFLRGASTFDGASLTAMLRSANPLRSVTIARP